MKKIVISSVDYFKCMLKSTDACPKFYSPSLRENTTDADGGVVIHFNDDTTSDRTAPRKIYIPAQDYETLPKHCYVNFNDEAVANGAPRYLTVEQYDSQVAKPASESASVSKSA